MHNVCTLSVYIVSCGIVIYLEEIVNNIVFKVER